MSWTHPHLNKCPWYLNCPKVVVILEEDDLYNTINIKAMESPFVATRITRIVQTMKVVKEAKASAKKGKLARSRRATPPNEI